MIISYGIHNSTTINQDTDGIRGYLTYPIAFSSNKLSIVGSCIDAGDIVQFINHTKTNCYYTVFDRYVGTSQTDAFFFIIIGF